MYTCTVTFSFTEVIGIRQKRPNSNHAQIQSSPGLLFDLMEKSRARNEAKLSYAVWIVCIKLVSISIVSVDGWRVGIHILLPFSESYSRFKLTRLIEVETHRPIITLASAVRLEILSMETLIWGAQITTPLYSQMELPYAMVHPSALPHLV